MKCVTRDFGEIELKEEEILTFIQPPFGFEEYTKYALLHDNETGKSIAWLQCVENIDICFILVDPEGFSLDYQPNFSQKDLDKLGLGDIICWTIAVIPDDLKNARVNLKSPILINSNSNLASQVILEGDYSIKHPLTKEVE